MPSFRNLSEKPDEEVRYVPDILITLIDILPTLAWLPLVSLISKVERELHAAYATAPEQAPELLSLLERKDMVLSLRAENMDLEPGTDWRWFEWADNAYHLLNAKSIIVYGGRPDTLIWFLNHSGGGQVVATSIPRSGFELTFAEPKTFRVPKADAHLMAGVIHVEFMEEEEEEEADITNDNMYIAT